LCSHINLTKNYCHRAWRYDKLFWVLKKVFATLSIFPMNFVPKNYIIHTLRQCTITIISFSCVAYLCSVLFSFQLMIATRCPSYTSTLPMTLSKASISPLNGLSKSSSLKTRVDITVVFNF